MLADPDFSTLTILLLKGVLHRAADERLWSALLKLQCRLRDYVAVLGLDVVVDATEGYAFLAPRAGAAQTAAAAAQPSVLTQRPLSFHVGLLLALLRRQLAEFDARGGESRLVLGREDIAAMLRPCLPAATSAARLDEEVQVHIDRVVALGFLRRFESSSGFPAYEVQRILRGFVDVPWLAELDRRLSSFEPQSIDAALAREPRR
ncbi:MAG: DUF4194 domain-containing protein [Betaproteobacteria bacterium]|nr:MAG: DUF4194 domain-containing protein [Betaproteobacteria bacterium]